MSKFIGTIVDTNYFDLWKEGDNVYRMCMTCDKPQLLKEGDKLTRGLKHYCEEKQNWGWVNFTRLIENGFAFIPAKEN